jgi:GH25 family lysozyme M1 (1,4-beta-N-acetylmuramidase)
LVKRAGVTFAIIKATEGTNYVDPMFAANRAGAEAAGIICGFYHFLWPGNISSISEQVHDYLDAVGESQLPPVLDLEASGTLNSRKPTGADARNWLEQMVLKTKRKPILYTSTGYWSALGYGTAMDWAVNYPLWLARYTTSWPGVLYPWARWSMWQWSSTCKIAGITGNVDADLFNGNATDLLAL